MTKKIISHNQKGGITAENVNIHGDTNNSIDHEDQPKRNKSKSILGMLVALAAIVACVFQILAYFRDGG